MKQKLIISLIIAVISIVSSYIFLKGGQASPELRREKPPEMNLMIDSEKYLADLGAYCWETMAEEDLNNKVTCVDAITPGLDFKPIKVQAGTEVFLALDYSLKPKEVRLVQETEKGEEEVELVGTQFIAPSEQGRYEYVYSVSWRDDKNSADSAFYGFILSIE